MDPASSQRVLRHIDVNLREAKEAEKALRRANVEDDDAVVGLSRLMDEITSKHDSVRRELESYGVSVPTAPTGLTDGLTGNLGTAGYRMQLERQIGDIQEACIQLKEAMEDQVEVAPFDEDEEEGAVYRPQSADHAVASSSRRRNGAARGKASSDVSDSASQEPGDDEDEEDVDSDVEPMTPRGVYVHRCLPLTKAEQHAETETYLAWLRTTRLNIFGLVVFLLYLLTTIAYIGVRAWWSLDGLGSTLWYGAIVLSAEILSATSLIFYGLWLCGRTDNSDMSVRDFDADKMRHLYVIRVFILARDEPLSLVRRTIASIRNAYLPDGCQIKVYLLDNAKDAAKRDFFMSAKAGADVIYIAPPPRTASDPKIVNWRSELMNFTLKLIYPEPDEEGRKNIASSELVCIIDADQTCSSSFFVNLLRYIDSGDDVGAAMNPRICYNVDPDCDIFDHQRVAYCERVQVGMDAYGFTALVGNNTLLRARALQEVDWLPVHTMTENWELGMLLRGAGWKSRYVPEYSAIGEAPAEICDSYERHYRASRGHFQTFWSHHCPLLQRDLGLFYRLMYASEAFKNFASAIWTPIITLVPIVLLIFGYFPLIFTNRWVVIAMIAHYAVRAFMLHWATSLKQVRGLWLARVCTTLLWWHNLKAATLTPAKVAIGPGASFKGRAWSGAVPVRNFVVLLWPMAVVVLSAIAFGGGAHLLLSTINAPIVLSMCLVFINVVPHLLVLFHWNFGQGQLMTRLCTLLLFLSWVAGIICCVFIYLLYPKGVDFAQAARNSLQFLDAQRSGALPPNYPVTWRRASGLQNQVTLMFVNETTPEIVQVPVDLTDGFYNDGEVGPVKVTWNIALTTTFLAWSMLEYPDFWTDAPPENLRNHAISLLAHGARYLQSCYTFNRLYNWASPGAVGPSEKDQLVYVVGTVAKERQLWRRPEDVLEPQFVGTVELSQAPSDLAGQVAASLVASALALDEFSVLPRAEASSMVNLGHRLFRSAVYSPGLYTDAFNGTDTGLEQNYPSFSFGDDLFWAATWLYRATLSNIRKANASYYAEAMSVTMDLAYSELDIPGVSWDYVNNAALVHAATITGLAKFYEPAQSFIWDWVCDREQVKVTDSGRAFYFQTPHLGATAAAAALAALYARRADPRVVNEVMIRGMECFAAEQASYILGAPLRGGRSLTPFLVGYDADDTYSRLWHRGASCPAYPKVCDISVAWSSEPDENVITGALLWNPVFTDRPTDTRGLNTTVVSLENNMAVPLLFPAVEMQSVTPAQCLNGIATAFWGAPWCRQGRPTKGQLGPRQAVNKLNPEFEGVYLPTTKPDESIPPPPPPSPTPLVSTF